MAENLTKKSEKDLEKLLVEKRSALRAFRFGGAGTRTRNVKEGKNVRVAIARILTELNQRPRRSAEDK